MDIVIIGANSFIARNIVSAINQRKKDGMNVRLKLYDYQEQHLDAAADYTSIDITSMESVSCVDFYADIIFVFAGKTGTLQGFEDYSTFIDINEKALLHILTAYVRAHSKAKIIFPSTRLVYKGRPGLLKEETDKECRTIYAMNKYACEEYLKMYHDLYNVKYAVFRIGVPYGTMVSGASSYGTVDFMIKKAEKGEDIILYGDGCARRTLTHMQDLCNILIDGALSEKCMGEAYNIGGEDYSLLEMAQIVARCYGVGVEHISWPSQALAIESGDTVFDSGKLDNLLRCRYRHTFQEWVCGSLGKHESII